MPKQRRVPRQSPSQGKSGSKGSSRSSSTAPRKAQTCGRKSSCRGRWKTTCWGRSWCSRFGPGGLCKGWLVGFKGFHLLRGSQLLVRALHPCSGGGRWERDWSRGSGDSVRRSSTSLLWSDKPGPQGAPLPSVLWRASWKSKPGPLQEVETPTQWSRGHMGKEPGRDGRAGGTSGASESMARKTTRRGERRIFDFRGRREKEEEEKEKEEKGGEGGEREEKVWWPNSGPKEAGTPVPGYGVRPGCENSPEGGKEGEKTFEEVQRYFKRCFRVINLGFSRRTHRGGPRRSFKATEDRLFGARGIDCRVNPAHDDLCGASHGRSLEFGRRDHPTGDEPIRETAPDRKRIRRASERSSDAVLCGGSALDVSTQRGIGCVDAALESVGAHDGWPTLGDRPTSRNSTQAGGQYFQQSRDPGGYERSEVGWLYKTARRFWKQRWRKRKDERQRKRKRRWEERQGQGPGQRQDLLRGGGDMSSGSTVLRPETKETSHRLLREGEKETKNVGQKKEVVLLRGGEDKKTLLGGGESEDRLLKRGSEERPVKLLRGGEKKKPDVSLLGSDEKRKPDVDGHSLQNLRLHVDAPPCPKNFPQDHLLAATSGSSFKCTVSPQTSDASDKCSGLGRAVCGKKSDCVIETGFGMGEVFDWLSGEIDKYLDCLCRVKPSGKIFPLPTSFELLASLFPEESERLVKTLRVLVLSLNSLNGEGLYYSGKISPLQREVLEGLVPDCVRVLDWEETSGPLSWDDFFKLRGVDYRGEEVLSARPICWENVSPALPEEVGQVPLSEVVEDGAKHYVLNFQDYMLPENEQVYTRPPKVMVSPEKWETLCSELLQRGVFSKIHESEVHCVGGRRVLNGLFGVSKQEFQGEWEVMRIIMNLIPANRLVRSLDADIATLPSWAGMSPLVLLPEEDLVVSSEDVRCFFYIFRLPDCWKSVMAFNRPLPDALCGDRPGVWYPCAAVLPMGFKNSVSLAQHVHRFITKRALQRANLGGELEMRKDRPFSRGNPLFRIYLDNFDELRRVSKGLAEAIEGKVSPLIAGLREEYQAIGVPRHPKKAVSSSRKAEVQGAVVDGLLGVAYPKPEKILKYVGLTVLLLKADVCNQKQAQVVGGGLVYLTMFRRPLLGCLNWLWKFVTSFEGFPPVVKLPIPQEVKLELSRFLGLVPLAYMDFRQDISSLVTASDASTTGGGVTKSCGVTPAGCVAAQCPVRGDLVEPSDVSSVLTIGLFDGIGALRVAADVVGWNVAGHISVEISPEAARVVEARFPNTVHIADVKDVNRDMVRDWAMRFSQVALVVLGAGPPCQGVSGLNASRKGALRDARSSLFSYVSKIRDMVKAEFPWAQVRSLMESVASMDATDEDTMSQDFGCKPWRIDAASVTLCRRPRLYWVDWELSEGVGCSFSSTNRSSEVILNAAVQAKDYLLPGWSKCSTEAFPTFTTSRPRDTPGYKPAGVKQCTAAELARWGQDAHRFPPYQYQTKFCLQNRAGDIRLPSIEEREVIMGFPRDYTTLCMVKSRQGSQAHLDCRLTLIGNSWNVVVVSWLLSQLGHLLGVNPSLTPQDIVSRCAPGCARDFQTFLQRPYMSTQRPAHRDINETLLVQKLLTMISVKGEDLLLQAASEDVVRYQRLRASVPSKLWKWQTVAGWRWSPSKEHINVLEMRAALTALRWRLEQRKSHRKKFVHLIDSLVCLHSLSRGRSSSLKLKRTLLRINSLLLATHSQALWAYVHTKDNPADGPSRHPRKRKWKRDA